jgi:hypothetical protein
MSYPANVSYFLRRLQGYHTNIFKLMPQNSDTASAGKIIQVNLPTNALLNMKSFAMHFDASATEAGGAGVARLPNKITSLIDRVEVLMGGITVQQGFNQYNSAVHIKENLSLNDDKKYSARLTLNHEAIPRGASYVDGQNLAPGTTRHEAYTDNPSFIIDEWIGFLGECEPQIIDSGLLPEMSIRITLAPDSVLPVGTDTDTVANFISKPGGSSATYSLSNIYFSIETMALQDGVYDSLLERKISEDGFIEIPYKNYYSYFDTHSGTTRFTAASQSVDKIYATFRANGYDTQGAPQLITGTDGSYNLSPFNAGERYVSNYFKFIDDSITDWQFTVNNTMFPQYKAKPLDAYHISRVARDKSHMTCKGDSITGAKNWRDFYWTAVIRLNHPSSEDTRLITGFDSRGVNAAMTFQTTKSGNYSTNLQCYVLAEMTATLRVGAGKAISVET